MTTVSVVGGTGFLGQRLVRHLTSEGRPFASQSGIPTKREVRWDAAGMERAQASALSP